MNSPTQSFSDNHKVARIIRDEAVRIKADCTDLLVALIIYDLRKANEPLSRDAVLARVEQFKRRFPYWFVEDQSDDIARMVMLPETPGRKLPSRIPLPPEFPKPKRRQRKSK